MKQKQIIGIGAAIFLVAMYAGIKMYASSVAKEKVDIAIANIASYADVDYEDVSVDLFGLDVHISDVVVSSVGSREKVNISEIVLSDVDGESDIPLFLDISFNGVEIAIDKFGNNAKELVELGYKDSILLNFSIEYHYNKENSEISLNKLKIGADDMGDLDISFRLGNIDLSPEGIQALLFTYPQITLLDAKISYDDDSLIERLVKSIAQKQDKSVKQIKNQAIKNIEKEIENEEDEFTKDALEEIKDFVDDPEEFTISIEPKNPLPLSRILSLRDPQVIIKILNVKIES